MIKRNYKPWHYFVFSLILMSFSDSLLKQNNKTKASVAFAAILELIGLVLFVYSLVAKTWLIFHKDLDPNLDKWPKN